MYEYKSYLSSHSTPPIVSDMHATMQAFPIPIQKLILARTLVFDSRIDSADTSDRYQTYTFTRDLDAIDVTIPIENLETVYDTLLTTIAGYCSAYDHVHLYNSARECRLALDEIADLHTSGEVNVYGDKVVHRWIRMAYGEDGEVDCVDIDVEDCPDTYLFIHDVLALASGSLVCTRSPDDVSATANRNDGGWSFDEIERKLTVYLGNSKFAVLSAMVPEPDDNCSDEYQLQN